MLVVTRSVSVVDSKEEGEFSGNQENSPFIITRPREDSNLLPTL
jgi:hypothetical protein